MARSKSSAPLWPLGLLAAIGVVYAIAPFAKKLDLPDGAEEMGVIVIGCAVWGLAVWFNPSLKANNSDAKSASLRENARRGLRGK
jgi:hypothetical protein